MYTPQETIVYKLLTMRGIIWAETKEALGRIGLTYENYMTLLFIYGNPGITQTGLSEINHRDRNVIGRVIDRLEELGYCQRVKDPVDRRVYRLQVTEAGKKVVVENWQYVLAGEERLLSRFSPEDREAFTAILSKI